MSFSMTRILDTDRQTWTLNKGPFHMVYLKGFTRDGSVRIRTLDWKNLECLNEAKNLASARKIVGLQPSRHGVILHISNQHSTKFDPKKQYRVIYDDGETQKYICSLGAIAYSDEEEYKDSVNWFRTFCITSAKRIQAVRQAQPTQRQTQAINSH